MYVLKPEIRDYPEKCMNIYSIIKREHGSLVNVHVENNLLRQRITLCTMQSNLVFCNNGKFNPKNINCEMHTQIMDIGVIV